MTFAWPDACHIPAGFMNKSEFKLILMNGKGKLMTSTTDHMISADPQLGSRPVEVPVLRFIMKILAGAAMLAALGLWLVPG